MKIHRFNSFNRKLRKRSNFISLNFMQLYDIVTSPLNVRTTNNKLKPVGVFHFAKLHQRLLLFPCGFKRHNENLKFPLTDFFFFFIFNLNTDIYRKITTIIKII